MQISLIMMEPNSQDIDCCVRISTKIIRMMLDLYDFYIYAE